MTTAIRPTAETVRDPDWIAARLRAAAASPHPPTAHRHLLAEIELWTTGADDTVARITNRPLPTLDWERRATLVWSGSDYHYVSTLLAHVSDMEHEDALATITAWATALGLPEEPEPQDGTRAWRGEVDGWRVELWTIVDRDAFEADV
jgi:hypothetical protein